MPAEAKKPFAWTLAAAAFGILLQIVTASFIFGSKLARIEAVKADRSELAQLRADYQLQQTELARWQGHADEKLSALLVSTRRIEDKIFDGKE
jgi:hypothetical protein